ncbi:amidase [Pseudarthrobacter sp. NKDBFgelt]|uniref:amidase n=1 Tax=Pseudarthrobacter sp. NKDBFgelt TaxID=3384443 RepID=UPI0038D3CB53
MDATELRFHISGGNVNAQQVQALARDAIEKVNPFINATVGPVLSEVPYYLADGPFGGVPFALKDLGSPMKGLRSECGSRLASGWTAPHDSHLAGRWRAAGLAVLARTTTPEFGANVTTEPLTTGATRNPWDLSRTPGGSSGGSAALVAAGALPMAHANDAAGSIRIPAALCGLVGLKPSRGRVPVGPDVDEPMNGLTSEFAITRTVRDTAALLDAVHGGVRGDRYRLDRRPIPFADRINLDNPIAFRIGIETPATFDTTTDPLCLAEVERVAQELQNLGHVVEPVGPALGSEEILDLNLRFWCASISETVFEFGDLPLHELKDRLERSTIALAREGRELSWRQIAEARAWQNQMTRRTAAAYRDFDFILTPTVSRPAWKLGELNANAEVDSARSWLARVLAFAPHTSTSNITGRPAISLPTGMAGRLPLGVQFSAHQGEEGDLLHLAAQIEQALPWADRRPDVHASKPVQLAPITHPATKEQVLA